MTAGGAIPELDSLDPLFEPRSVAIIGLSRSAVEAPVSILTTLKDFGFDGQLYVINPNFEGGRRESFQPTIAAIGEPVDLAIVTVERGRVLGVLRDCVAAGTRAAIVITQGFADADETGRAMQEEIAELARTSDLRVLGPNTLGVTNAFANFTSSFFEMHNEPGPVASISQSGLFLMGHNVIGNELAGFGIGVDLGNACDVGLGEVLRYFARDDRVSVIQCHIESVVDGPDFLATAGDIARRKPIIALKAGRTKTGSRAIASHSGAVAGETEVYRAAFAMCGIVEAESAEELRLLAKAFSILRPPKGDHVAVISFSGGAGIMAIDSIEASGLRLAHFAPETKAELGALYPDWLEVNNPLDIWVPVSRDFHATYPRILKILLQDDAVDALICIYPSFTLPKYEAYDSARHIRDLAGQFPEKPVLCWSYGLDLVGFSREIERERTAMVFPSLVDAARTLRKLLDYGRFRRSKHSAAPPRFKLESEKARAVLTRAAAAGEGYLVAEALELLSAYGIAVAPWRLTGDRAEVAQCAASLRPPLCLKAISPDIVHKSEFGGVILDITEPERLLDAYDTMTAEIAARANDARLTGVLVQEMVPAGHEFILGAKRDPVFGPCLIAGAGGTLTEMFDDFAFVLAPLSATEARAMIESLRYAKVLRGGRGQTADLEAIVEMLLRLSLLVTDHPEIAEFDVNPVIVNPNGAVVVDARMRLARPSRGELHS